MDEEAIFVALAERMTEVVWLENAVEKSFVTTDRRVRLFSDVPVEQQPACFQAEHGDTYQQVSNLPYKVILEANWIIYQAPGMDLNVRGAILNNLILKGCREALKPKPQDEGWFDERNTLNGLVYHCFISGRVFKDPGDIDGQGMIVVPIKLLVP